MSEQTRGKGNGQTLVFKQKIFEPTKLGLGLIYSIQISAGTLDLGNHPIFDNRKYPLLNGLGFNVPLASEKLSDAATVTHLSLSLVLSRAAASAKYLSHSQYFVEGSTSLDFIESLCFSTHFC